ncbi:Alpha/Beta hydrolase protein [Xylariales sp. PMI_506]|nr:Alpha/Beta hydrolase protein [Xylariales sp. PMI_506]
MEKRSAMGGSAQVPRMPGFGLGKSVVLGILLCLAIFKLPGRLPAFTGRCHSGGLEYEGEQISWEVCGDLNGRPLECGEINVPMDQFSLDNPGNKTFSIPLIRLRGANATQNILLNPGGPGVSGIEFMLRKGETLSQIIGEGFHLVSFDPRGVGSSRPAATCFPNDATQSVVSALDPSIIDNSPDLFAWYENIARACRDSMGEYGMYINTPQTAADMNSILDALGQQDLVYWGFSYGTLLGQTYATMFPERVGRVIIDGVGNNFDWYESLLNTEVFTDTETVFWGFFDECIKAGRDCPLTSLGSSKEELRDKILGLLSQLGEQPLSVYVNTSVYGVLTREKMLYNAILPALQKPAAWYDLANHLTQLLEGNATDSFFAYGQQDVKSHPGGDSYWFVILNDGRSGPDFWPQDRQSLVDMLIPYTNQSRFSASENGDYYLKQHWDIPKTHNFIPVSGVQTKHSLLILSTSYDPVCPLLSAKSANVAFEGSQIVEVKSYGHCSNAVPSGCLARHVRDFLYNGHLPAQHTQCEADGPYFIKPQL